MSRADDQRAYRQNDRAGVKLYPAGTDERTFYALHRAGLLTEKEAAALSDDKAAFRRRAIDAITAALDQWTDSIVAPLLDRRKIPLRVTHPRARRAYPIPTTEGRDE